MYDEPVGSDVSCGVDVKIMFPDDVLSGSRAPGCSLTRTVRLAGALSGVSFSQRRSRV